MDDALLYIDWKFSNTQISWIKIEKIWKLITCHYIDTIQSWTYFEHTLW
jgi:hypothetical protein